MLPLIFTLLGLLLVVIIAYNTIQQYNQKVQTDKRISLAKQNAIIAEVDELLLQATKLPFSKTLLLILQNRVRNALLNKISILPNSPAFKENFADVEAQIKQIKDNYTESSSTDLKIPDSEKESIALIQVAKKLRAVLRSEHAKGKIDTTTFVAENKTLEILQFKINLENNIKRINQAVELKHFGTAKQTIDKLTKIIEAIPNKDQYMEEKLAYLLQYQQEVLVLKEEKAAPTYNNIAENTQKEKERDEIFADKKKW